MARMGWEQFSSHAIRAIGQGGKQPRYCLFLYTLGRREGFKGCEVTDLFRRVGLKIKEGEIFFQYRDNERRQIDLFFLDMCDKEERVQVRRNGSI